MLAFSQLFFVCFPRLTILARKDSLIVVTQAGDDFQFDSKKRYIGKTLS